ncbi:MAG: hypothetical protein RMM53_10510, partial [Bacteroidia bacterium]|nr:hypothetical protein [Bacteroidia bacterium]MDW8334635.1 hypothetical protein [Bacteroidia bacterium]
MRSASRGFAACAKRWGTSLAFVFAAWKASGQISIQYDFNTCGTGKADLTAPSGSSYLWFPGSQTVQTITVTSNGLYSVLVDGTDLYATDAEVPAILTSPVFPPITGGDVLCSVREGNILYIGGTFTSVGSFARNRLAAIDVVTGAVLPWNPDVSNGAVNAMVKVGNFIYIGGTFTGTVGGFVRTRLAAVNATTGATIAGWNPTANNTVNALAVNVNNATIYIGGTFTNVNSTACNRLAALNLFTGALDLSWNPGLSAGAVHALAVHAGTLYVGGSFNSAVIGGQTRSNLAGVSITTGTATALNLPPNGIVRALVVEGNHLFVGGGFTLVGAQSRNGLAKINLASNTLETWTANLTSGQVYSLAVKNGDLYFGGSFLGNFGAGPRGNLASVNAATGAGTTWNPSVNAIVRTLAVGNCRAYAGGSFTGKLGYFNITPNIPNVTAVQNGCNFTASGANIYCWSTGHTGPSMNYTVTSSMPITVYGINTTTGCMDDYTFVASPAITEPIVEQDGPILGCNGEKVVLSVVNDIDPFDDYDLVVWNGLYQTATLEVEQNGVYTYQAFKGNCVYTGSVSVNSLYNEPANLPSVTGSVFAVREFNGILYIGGNFTT